MLILLELMRLLALLCLAGLYLSLDDIASYGLMTQVVSILSAVANVFFSTFIPSINNYKVLGYNDKVLNSFARCQVIFILVYLLGAFTIILLGPWALTLIKSNALLPENHILILYLAITLLENNHANFATVITASNKVPFVSAALISGALICVLDFITLQFTYLGMLGIVLVPGIVQLVYNNWYWPMYVLKEYHISFYKFIKIGFNEIIKAICNSNLCVFMKNKLFLR